MPKQYVTTTQCYLRMKGVIGDPILIEEGTLIGEDTPYDFEGTPSMGMRPVTPAAEEEHESMLQSAAGGPPTVKDTPQPSDGGAAPFDPASGEKGSDAEKNPSTVDPKKSDAAAASKK